MARCGGCCLVAAAWLCFGGSAQAQTNPLAAISGRVADPSGAPLGGVKVSVSSPALQGLRGSETTAAGDFLIPFLPPGEYEIAFRRDGFHAERDLLDASAWYDERKLGLGSLPARSARSGRYPPTPPRNVARPRLAAVYGLSRCSGLAALERRLQRFPHHLFVDHQPVPSP